MKIHPETGKVLTGFHVDVEPQTRYTCFISHSSKDLPFIQKLHTDLQANNVVCWYAPENLKIGDKFWYRINESIEGYDKFLVILSENSLESEWVEKEVMAALEKEDKQPNRLVLFPIMIDKAVTKTKKPWGGSYETGAAYRRLYAVGKS